MRTTIDGAGRLVIPKPLRERLGLGGGAEVEISETAHGLAIVPVINAPAIEEREGLPVIRADVDQVITDEQVRQLRDLGRR